MAFLSPPLRVAAALPVLLALCSPARPLRAEAPAPVGLEELIRLILDLDPELERLRGEWAITTAQAKEFRWWEDPELRVSYTREGDQALPRPYTETVRQTRQESGSFSARGTRSRQGSGNEDRLVQEDFQADETSRRSSTFRESESLRESGSINLRRTETTTREITPLRDRVRVREVTRVAEDRNVKQNASSSSRFSETEQETTPTFFGDINTQTTAEGGARENEQSTTQRSERVTRVDTSERLYGYDPYAGTDEYSFQLRLYPLNPWEVRSEVRKTLAEASLAEFMVVSAERVRALEIREIFREAQFKLREAEALTERADLLKRHLSYLDQVEESGILDDRRHRVRASYFESTLEAENLRQQAQAELLDLAAQAGLDDPDRIDLTNPGTPPLVDVQGLDTNLLVRVALDHDPDYGRAALESKVHRAELSVKQAARIPWLSLITAEYAYDELDGRRVQDAYTVLAGIQVPIFTWMDRDLGAGEKAALTALQRQQESATRRATARVRHALRSLGEALTALEKYRQNAPAVEQRIRDELARLAVVTPATQRIRYELERALVDMRAFAVERERLYAEALLRLEAALGTGIHVILGTRETGPTER
jgi:hypothetical protein